MRLLPGLLLLLHGLLLLDVPLLQLLCLLLMLLFYLLHSGVVRVLLGEALVILVLFLLKLLPLLSLPGHELSLLLLVFPIHLRISRGCRRGMFEGWKVFRVNQSAGRTIGARSVVYGLRGPVRNRSSLSGGNDSAIG